tara:strand:- start:7 stop:480 length:474 start_codon:yes stop_codon:yes gene_type:complete
MKLSTLTLAVLALTFTGCGVESIETVDGEVIEEIPEEPGEEVQALPAGFLGNTTCPFSGKQVDPDSFYEHRGERIYFCTPQCAIDGSKDPDKYRSQVYAETTPVGNTTCPVNGEEIVDPIPAYWQGHEVSLCCTFCLNSFEDDPETFVLAALDSLED